MTTPGSEYPTPGRPDAVGGAEATPQAEPAKKSNTKKWASLAGTVVVVGAGAAYTLTGGFGIGDPAVNDCIHMKGETDFEVVDCGSDDADAKVVGIEDEKLTEDEFMADPESCADFADAEGAIWSVSGMITEKGTVYCVAAV